MEVAFRYVVRSLAVAGAAVLLCACQAVGTGSTLSGSGDPLKDVPAVQAAVDAGGVVRLRGTFEFGDRGRVQIHRDVQIVGVEGATIRGGFFTFSSPLPQGVAPFPASPKIAIRNLSFEDALYGPINIGSASELVIKGNRIGKLRTFPFELPGYKDAQATAGILVGTAWATPPGAKRQYLPGVLTGAVSIEENVIELKPTEPTKTLGYGMMVQFTTGIQASIQGNTITGATRTCIEFIDNYRGPAGEGRILIARNRLQTNEGGIAFPGAQTPNAVLVGYFADRSAAADPSRFVEHVVENNEIETRGPTSMGVAALTNAARVTGNVITSTGDKAASVLVAASDVEVKGNKLLGRGGNAFVISGLAAMKGTGNRIVANDLSGFEALNSHVMFAKTAEDNTCAGLQSIVKVADEGQRNRCP